MIDAFLTAICGVVGHRWAWPLLWPAPNWCERCGGQQHRMTMTKAQSGGRYPE